MIPFGFFSIRVIQSPLSGKWMNVHSSCSRRYSSCRTLAQDEAEIYVYQQRILMR